MPRLSRLAPIIAASLLAACAGAAPGASGPRSLPSTAGPPPIAARLVPGRAATMSVTKPVSSIGTCGGVVMAKPGGGTWQCSFDDEFNGTSLNAGNWVVQQTATSGFATGSASGAACYVSSPNNVSVAGGYLNLTVRREPQPVVCRDPFGSFTTQYTSGMVSSYGLFTQAYGLFEVRAKLPAATVPGLQETLWLWPANDVKYGAWPGSGEIDFAEFYSKYPTLDIPYVHYNAARPDPNVTSYSCVIGNQNQFHTYGVEWTSSSLTVLYDGKTCLVDRWTPAAPLVAPEPFNQPFLVALTQALGVNANSFQSGTTPLPATTQIDWVRIWK